MRERRSLVPYLLISGRMPMKDADSTFLYWLASSGGNGTNLFRSICTDFDVQVSMRTAHRLSTVLMRKIAYQ